ncbi:MULTISPECIES: competence type IV pilus minor pilin ComGD [Geobacillus]|uniref:ComG operon protein 4 n=2 Tax=Geobacillus thermodenitrificans TaxID=33940 RepID=A4IQW2_GEOTN|nr:MULTISPECIES: competence type IV pilus minor pilin ComGD [Geobacillus]ABO67716.1 ComG operon protein 4 [Geobacillus thermodenitrificans NG80-2]ARA99147.1 competence protein ComG [Geobacillus thermodenitrificans]ARP43462.1 Competence protein ComGC [Geobacillus thermodenitrificans]ATO38461.1 competence protein ComG [Geobacillus thermodenitrificans]KQB92598.1 competence protein ComG [Geobacillus sp. PA-3]
MARNGGFTLLEMLVVLSIVLLLAALAVPELGGIMQQREEAYMLALLRADLYGAQQHAIAKRGKVSVFFTEGRGEYRVVDAESGQQIVVRTLPAPWRFQIGTLRNPVVFTDNGNIEQGGTVWVKSSENSYKVTFLLGKGRFYVQKM